MGEGLHRDATTTAAVRRAIRHGQEGLRGLATRYGINPKAVAHGDGHDRRSLAETAMSRPKRLGDCLGVRDPAVGSPRCRCAVHPEHL